MADGLIDNDVEVRLLQQVHRAAGNECPDCGRTDKHDHDRGEVAIVMVSRSVAERFFGKLKKGSVDG